MIIGPRRERSGLALKRILEQDGIAEAEVLLIDVCADQFPPLPGSEHPSIQVIANLSGMHFGEMRAWAANKAQKGIVAYLEEHVFPHPGWLRGIEKGIGYGWAGVGGEIYNPYPNIGTSNVYLSPRVRRFLLQLNVD
ncbi:MAG: hypothetical protein HC806_05155 [Anaerolineae bacterium]|nr:hypothetical protein [Anaerolineae bacterium]